jgi:hypothetical protein
LDIDGRIKQFSDGAISGLELAKLLVEHSEQEAIKDPALVGPKENVGRVIDHLGHAQLHIKRAMELSNAL